MDVVIFVVFFVIEGTSRIHILIDVYVEDLDDGGSVFNGIGDLGFDYLTCRGYCRYHCVIFKRADRNTACGILRFLTCCMLQRPLGGGTSIAY